MQPDRPAIRHRQLRDDGRGAARLGVQPPGARASTAAATRPRVDADVVEPGQTAASKQFELGIGPGCSKTDDAGGITGHAIPPVRIKEVCQGLDQDLGQRCCIDSICSDDYSQAFACLTGVIQTIVDPIE